MTRITKAPAPLNPIQDKDQIKKLVKSLGGAAPSRAAPSTNPRRMPQVLITLSPSGNLQAELPGANGARRVVPIRDLESIERMLRGQLSAHYEIGEDGAPTSRQVRHWERHDVFADPQCPFCIAEGRIKKANNAGFAPFHIIARNRGVVIRRRNKKPQGATKLPQNHTDVLNDL